MPQRTTQTGIDDVEIKVSKVIRDRSGTRICFNSSLLPPNLKRVKVSKFLPWMYCTYEAYLALIFTKLLGAASW
ncbi:MAG: hypothetical protein ACTS73_03345 [Arsenophonus sp. NEOnobi-MAG3]